MDRDAAPAPELILVADGDALVACPCGRVNLVLVSRPYQCPCGWAVHLDGNGGRLALETVARHGE